MRILAEFIMRGRTPAVMVASAFAILSMKFAPVSIVSSGAIALVTLRKGAQEGIITLLAASLAAAVFGLLLQINYLITLSYGLVLWLPIWVISVILREGRHLSLAVEMAAVMGVIGVIIFYSIVGNPAAFWEPLLFQMAKSAMGSNMSISDEDLLKQVAVFAHYMTGVVAAGTVYGLLFGLFLGRWWQAMLYNPGGFKSEYLALNSHKTISLITILLIITALLNFKVISEISWNAIILFFVLYTLIGAAVLHVLLAKTKAGNFLIPLMYLTLLIIPHSLPMIALIGIGDSWAHFRNKNLNHTDA